MARKKGVRITVVVEDEMLERFSRDVLLKFGFSRHELRVAPYPVGQGSAKDWVDKQYPIAIRVLRTKAYQNLGVLVGTDADEGTVVDRFNRLTESLQQQGIASRGDDERIVIWVPKWNVETWILHFSGDTRDEDHDHKHDVRKPNFSAVAEAFFNEYRSFKNDNTIATLPSLRTAYDETKRLDD